MKLIITVYRRARTCSLLAVGVAGTSAAQDSADGHEISPHQASPESPEVSLVGCPHQWGPAIE